MNALLMLLASLLPFVNPFIGTGGNGSAYPGAAYPFGMMQLSPVTRCCGDSLICGFSHTRQRGPGGCGMSDLRVMPAVGAEDAMSRDYASTFSRAHEHASPGYYEVFLDGPKVFARMTVGRRAGMHEYTFPTGCEPMLIIKLLPDGGQYESTMMTDKNNPYLIYGGCTPAGHGEGRAIYFYMEFTRPLSSSKVDSTVAVLHFKQGRGSNVLGVRVGISSISCNNARMNLADENILSFNGLKEYTENEWESFLGTVDCPYEDTGRRTSFYTALYRCGLCPALFSDVDGRYFSNGLIWKSLYFDRYSVFPVDGSPYGLYPLLREYAPGLTSEFIRSMLAAHQERGRLPDYGCAPAIADAILHGIPDIPKEEILGALIACSYADGFGLDCYRHNGCVTDDDETGSVCQTLHYAYYDWCVAQIAGYLAETEADAIMQERYAAIHKRYMTSSQYWRNVFDPVTGCMRARRNGRWAEISLKDSFFVPHDMMGLMRAMGGPTRFCSGLDSLFRTAGAEFDASPYLYSIAGRPEKTKTLVDTLMTRFQNGESGDPANTWYVLSSLGEYPTCPANTGPDKTWIAKTIVVNPVFEMETDVVEDSMEVRITNVDAGARAFYSIGRSGFKPYPGPFMIYGPDTLRCYSENLSGTRSFTVQSVISRKPSDIGVTVQ